MSRGVLGVRRAEVVAWLIGELVLALDIRGALVGATPGLEDQLSAEDRAERGSYVGCIAGALSKVEYEAGLTAAGFTEVSVAFTHQVGDGLHSAIIKASKPTVSSQPNGVTASAGQAALPLVTQPGCC